MSDLSHKPLARRTFPAQLRTLMMVFFVLEALSLLYILRAEFLNHSLSQALFQDLVRDYDLLCYRDRFAFFGAKNFFQFPGQVFNYPAPVALVFWVFYHLSDTPSSVYNLIILTWPVATAGLFIRSCRITGLRTYQTLVFTIPLLFLSYPVLLVGYLQNVELIVWIIVSFGIWAFLKGHYWTAAFCFGIAGSLKYFPLIYLCLFAPVRQWRQIALGVASFLLSMLTSLWILGPTVKGAAAGLRGQMEKFTSYYLYNWHPTESSIDHSLFGAFKLGLASFHATSLLPNALASYYVIVGSGLIVTYLLCIRQLPLLSRILALTIIAVWLMPLSHDYSLLQLYAPCAAFVLALLKNREARPSVLTEHVAYGCFGALFATTVFMRYRAVGYGGQVKCALLAFLFFCALARVFEPTNVKVERGA